MFNISPVPSKSGPLATSAGMRSLPSSAPRSILRPLSHCSAPNLQLCCDLYDLARRVSRGRSFQRCFGLLRERLLCDSLVLSLALIAAHFFACPSVRHRHPCICQPFPYQPPLSPASPRLPPLCVCCHSGAYCSCHSGLYCCCHYGASSYCVLRPLLHAVSVH